MFRRRLAELGYGLRRKPDPSAAERLAKLADPNIGDLEKIAPEREDEADPFAEIRRRMAEGDFDAMTVNLMNWYIAEEKDSARRLREAYGRVRGTTRGRKRAGGGSMAEGSGADAEAIMACMTAGFASLEKSLAKLVKASK